MRGYEIPPLEKFRGTDYTYETDEPLSDAALEEGRLEALTAFEKHFPAAVLHAELDDFLGNEVTREHDLIPEEGLDGKIVVYATKNAPETVPKKFHEHVWMRGDFFEHDHCYIGVDASSGELPVFIDFTTGDEVAVDVDLHGSTEHLVALMRMANSSSNS